MAAPYIPVRQIDRLAWENNFSTLITANPGLYGLVAADAVAIAAAVAAFSTALTLAIDPATRTPASVASKDTQDTATQDLVRPYAIQIRNNAGVANVDKAALGLTIPDRTPTPIIAPVTTPVITLVGATPLEVTLGFRDATTPLSKAKPSGSIQLEVHALPSATVITDPDAIPMKKIVTKSPFVLDFDAGDVGKQCYIVGRWLTRRGLTGPWSAILNATVFNA